MNRRIKYLVIDVDGTLTDGRLYIGAQGESMKAFNVKDGYGIHDLLPEAGIVPVVITGRNSEIVKKRCAELCVVDVFQGRSDKLQVLLEFASSRQEDLACFGYMGDDLNDLPCMKMVMESNGLTGCPSDAVQQIKNVSSFVASLKGGDGAVREFIDWLLSE